jgi:hypothetical protein
MKKASGLVAVVAIMLVANCALAEHPGDYDLDGDVDGADFVAWQTAFPSKGPHGDNVGDHDGDIDGADFVIWQTNFPYTPSPATVPEPSTCALVLLSVPALFALRRWRR